MIPDAPLPDDPGTVEWLAAQYDGWWAALTTAQKSTVYLVMESE